MNDLNVDPGAINYIKQYLDDGGSIGLRLFIAGEGCCSRLEITPVEKPISTDITFHRGGLDFHVEKVLVESTSSIEIKYDEESGLLIDLIE